jgi:hypothetical protein
MDLTSLCDFLDSQPGLRIYTNMVSEPCWEGARRRLDACEAEWVCFLRMVPCDRGGGETRERVIYTDKLPASIQGAAIAKGRERRHLLGWMQEGSGVTHLEFSRGWGRLAARDAEVQAGAGAE